MLIENPRAKWKLRSAPVNWPGTIEKGCLPIDISPDSLNVRWIKSQPMSLDDPFFFQSVARIRRGAAFYEVDTDVSYLEYQGTSHLAPVVPAGIICHMTRSGSTLVSNVLKSVENVVGISEAGPVEFASQLASSSVPYWRAKGRILLERLVSVYAHYHDSSAKKVIIKCGLQGCCSLKAIREVWHQVPCLVVIRDPAEVLVSNLMTPARWLLQPSPTVADVSEGLIRSAGAEEWAAWTLGNMCHKVLESIDENCLVVDYKDLSLETLMRIGETFGLSVLENAVQAELSRNAKHTDKPFESDASRKQKEADVLIRSGAEKWMNQVYSRLADANQGVKTRRKYL